MPCGTDEGATLAKASGEVVVLHEARKGTRLLEHENEVLRGAAANLS
ncbi:hypothetical protein GCM10010095_81130 [Streptomyces anthocyanicus]|nr:hypothetical protein GCM10010095_81130 [Streptomyces anthocyanicus]